MLKILFKKTILFALIAALGLASLPVFGVSAAGQNDPTPEPKGAITNERLERIWARQITAYNRLGKTDQFIEKVQKLIDRASANGKDVSAVQAALEAFADTWKDAKPIYASMNGIVNSHQGFDDHGKVTDADKARETVREMHEKFKEIRATLDGTGKALRDAIKAFRQANPRPKP
jgi:phage-related tail protein